MGGGVSSGEEVGRGDSVVGAGVDARGCIKS